LLNWTVTGAPTAPYSIRFTLADAAPITFPNFNGAGSFGIICSSSYPSLFAIPVTVTIDPTNVSGNTTPLAATTTRTFTPTLPATAVAYYNPQTLFGAQTMTVPVTAGNVAKLVMLLGKPTTDTFQAVQANTSTGVLLSAQPAAYPVFEKVLKSVGAGSYTLHQTFQVAVSNVASNPALIRTTWAQVDSIKTSLAHFLNPEQLVETADPTIIAFTNAALPVNYRTTLTPLQVAEKLFTAVVKAITYKTPISGDAVTVLQTKLGDCGGMSNLYDACLRVTGIPCRCVCGWGTDGTTHCWSEIYFPGTGWVPADTSLSRLTSVTCNAMPFFGYLPTGNQHCAVCRASTLITPDITTSGVQIGAFTVASGTVAPTVGAMTWTVGLGTTPLP
jgi:hypothetical protein